MTFEPLKSKWALGQDWKACLCTLGSKVFLICVETAADMKNGNNSSSILYYDYHSSLFARTVPVLRGLFLTNKCPPLVSSALHVQKLCIVTVKESSAVLPSHLGSSLLPYPLLSWKFVSTLGRPSHLLGILSPALMA